MKPGKFKIILVFLLFVSETITIKVNKRREISDIINDLLDKLNDENDVFSNFLFFLIYTLVTDKIDTSLFKKHAKVFQKLKPQIIDQTIENIFTEFEKLPIQAAKI